MANKKASGKKSTAQSSENVVRIKASSSAPKKEKVTAAKSTAVATPAATVKTKRPKRGFNVFSAIIGYFTGAWYELRQVRWPNRRATWGLTGAVLLYSAFFVILVLLLDALFKYLFELILGK